MSFTTILSIKQISQMEDALFLIFSLIFTYYFTKFALRKFRIIGKSIFEDEWGVFSFLPQKLL